MKTIALGGEKNLNNGDCFSGCGGAVFNAQNREEVKPRYSEGTFLGTSSD